MIRAGIVGAKHDAFIFDSPRLIHLNPSIHLETLMNKNIFDVVRLRRRHDYRPEVAPRIPSPHQQQASTAEPRQPKLARLISNSRYPTKHSLPFHISFLHTLHSPTNKIRVLQSLPKMADFASAQTRILARRATRDRTLLSRTTQAHNERA